MKWIVTANSNQCRIYEYERKSNHLDLCYELNCPKNRLHSQDLVASRPGRHNKDGIAGTYEQAHDPEEILIDKFARKVAKKLDDERNKHHYEELFMIMPSDMEGIINHHLSKQVKEKIKKYIRKNIMRLSSHELLKQLPDYTSLPAK